MGLFGISEVIASIGRADSARLKTQKITLRSMLPHARRLAPLLGADPARHGHRRRSSARCPARGPPSRPSCLCGGEADREATPARFGKGAIEGVVAPEAANNAAAQTAFIPTLTLGIPGDAVMALMLGALIIHGIQPGPRLMTEHPELFWGLIASFWIGNVMLVILNIPLIGIWVRLLKIPYQLPLPGHRSS